MVRVAVVGGGAIGGTLAAFAALDGRDVCVVDADALHVAAINVSGLRVSGVASFVSRLPAFSLADAPRDLDAALLAVRDEHLPEAVSSIVPRLGPDGVLATIQNGLAAEQVAELVGTDRVLAGSVSFGAVRQGPGEIVLASRGPVHFGELRAAATPRLRRFVGVFEPYGEVVADDDVWGFIWAKLAVAAVLVALALDGRPNADVLADAELHRGLGDVLGCVARTATAHGVRLQPIKGVDIAGFAGWPSLPPDFVAASFETLAAIARGARDNKPYAGTRAALVERRGGAEVEPLLSPVVRRCRDASLDAAPLERLLEAVAAVDRGDRKISPELLRDALGTTMTAATVDGGRREHD